MVAAKNLPKIFTASSDYCSMHIEGSSIAGFNDGVAKLVADPHLVEFHHRFVTKRRFGTRLVFVAGEVIVIK